MPITGLYPDIFPTPEESVFGMSDYGWYSNNTLPQANYMEGLENAQSTGMMCGGYQGTAFSTMGLDNDNNAHDPTMSLPLSSFNSNAQLFSDIHPTVPVSTPVYGYAQAPSFDHGSNFAPASTIPTSAMPNSISIPAVAPVVTPLTPTETIFTIATPTTVADYASNYGTPASDLPEPQPSRRASASEPTGSRKRVYRTLYDHRDSHRYTCHPCRFSTDVKRDFSRHTKTDKHKRRHSEQKQ